MDKHSLTSRVPIIKRVKFDFETFNEIYFKRFIAGFMILVIVALGIAGYKINEIRTRGYEVFLGDTSLGYVRDENLALTIMNDYNDNLTNTYDLEILFEDRLSFEPVNVNDQSLITRTSLNKNIRSQANYIASAYALNIEGVNIGIVGSQEEAEEILEEIKAPYVSNIDENSTLIDAKLLEETEIGNAHINIDEIGKKEDIVEYIRTGGEEIKTHIVEVGESYWTIAKIYDMPVEDLMAENPGTEESQLKPGDSVTISVPTSIATVVTREEVKSRENVDYQVIIEENANMYQDEKTVKVEGKAGVANVTSLQTKHNGSLVEEETISEEIIEEPVNQVAIQGTKERPKTMATGSFSVPTRGRISSRYGRRWGRMHQGIDFAAPTGTAITAADGGIVTKAEHHKTYGYMVEINHENGYTTRYAHASKMHVSAGSRVYKGQHIANVGNTGRSTGPHLHFEVLLNGVNKNPSGYIY